MESRALDCDGAVAGKAMGRSPCSWLDISKPMLRWGRGQEGHGQCRKGCRPARRPAHRDGTAAEQVADSSRPPLPAPGPGDCDGAAARRATDSTGTPRRTGAQTTCDGAAAGWPRTEFLVVPDAQVLVLAMELRLGKPRTGHRPGHACVGGVPAMELRPGRPRTGSATSASARGKKSCDGAAAKQSADSTDRAPYRGHPLRPAIGPQPSRPRTVPSAGARRPSAPACDGAAAGQAADSLVLRDLRILVE
jgi:hypothetical protein